MFLRYFICLRQWNIRITVNWCIRNWLLWNRYLIVTVWSIIVIWSSIYTLLNLRVCVYRVIWVYGWSLALRTIFLKVSLGTTHLSWLKLMLRRLAMILRCRLAHASRLLIHVSRLLIHVYCCLSCASYSLAHVSNYWTWATRHTLLLNSLLYRSRHALWIFCGI